MSKLFVSKDIIRYGTSLPLSWVIGINKINMSSMFVQFCLLIRECDSKKSTLEFQ